MNEMKVVMRVLMVVRVVVMVGMMMDEMKVMRVVATSLLKDPFLSSSWLPRPSWSRELKMMTVIVIIIIIMIMIMIMTMVIKAF